MNALGLRSSTTGNASSMVEKWLSELRFCESLIYLPFILGDRKWRVAVGRRSELRGVAAVGARCAVAKQTAKCAYGPGHYHRDRGRDLRCGDWKGGPGACRAATQQPWRQFRLD